MSSLRARDLASAWEQRATQTHRDLLKKRREEQRKRQQERTLSIRRSKIEASTPSVHCRSETSENISCNGQEEVVEETNSYFVTAGPEATSRSVANEQFETPKTPEAATKDDGIQVEKQRAQRLLQQLANAATPSAVSFEQNSETVGKLSAGKAADDEEIIVSPSTMKRRQDTQHQSGNKQEPLATLLSPLFSRVETRQIDDAVESQRESYEGKNDTAAKPECDDNANPEDMTALWVKKQQIAHQQSQEERQREESMGTSSTPSKVSEFLKLLDETEAADKRTLNSTFSQISPSGSTFLSNVKDSNIGEKPYRSPTVSLLNNSRAVVKSIMGDAPYAASHLEDHDDEFDRESSISAYAPSAIAASLAPSNNTYASTVRAKVTGLAMEVEDKTRTVVLMKKKLHASRIKASEREEQFSKEQAMKIKEVRGEYEETIQRHLAFIDRLLADKQSLSEKCDLLTQELKRMEKMFNDSIAELKRRHELETKKAKDIWHASEKIKRENWMQVKTREIKNTTIKGLEPEVQRILSKHKKELRRMEEKNLQEQTKIKQELVEKHEESMRRLRDKMEEQREDIVSSEENSWREKFRSLTKNCEIRVEELRAKMEQREEQQRQRYERDREQQIYMHDAAIKQLQSEHKKKRNEMEVRHQQILDDLHAKQDARLTVESARLAEARQEWQQIQLEKMKLENKEKEKAFREKLRRERDRQIDEIIQKLDDENTEAQLKIKAECDKRVNQLEGKLQRNMEENVKMLSEERERSERITKQSKHSRDEITKYESDLQRMQEELVRSKSQNAKYIEEINNKEILLRREYAEKRSDDLKTISMLKAQVSRLEVVVRDNENETRRKLDAERKKNEEGIHSLHDRVKETIGRKDNMIAMLKEQVLEGEMRAKTAEMLLEKQRVELLG